uniref:Uncharacterized protein n=1 Tax=Anguilla anguilla TaxID=7936 RepID=A0A0E9US00_ANGAN
MQFHAQLQSAIARWRLLLTV